MDFHEVVFHLTSLVPELVGATSQILSGQKLSTESMNTRGSQLFHVNNEYCWAVGNQGNMENFHDVDPFQYSTLDSMRVKRFRGL